MIVFEFHKGLPVEYESFLKEKYDSYIITCRYIEIYYPTYDINYFLVYIDSQLVDVIIFGNSGNTSQCFNSLANIDQNVINELIKKIFDKYNQIKKIIIDASYRSYTINKSFLLCKSDDHILFLPATMDEYYNELGYHTRKNIRSRKKKLSNDFENLNFAIKTGIEVDETLTDKIIQLNCERLKKKGIKPQSDKLERNNIYRYSQQYGCVTCLEINGEIVAGCISTIVNKGIFVHVISFDNNFSKYNVGEVCVFQLIQNSIEKGLTTIHFLWGETELKKRLLAKPQILYSYLIFRAYSFDYILSKTKTIFIRLFVEFKLSKLTLPFRNVIKYFRKRYYKV